MVILMRKSATFTTWKPTWNNTPTCVIRIPQAFKNQVEEYAKALDSKTEPNTATALLLMEAYLNKYDLHQINSSSPRWYQFNKFRDWLAKIV